MIVAKILLWVSLVVLLWTYLIYPLFVMILTYVFRRSCEKETYRGSVSFIVPAYNEEDVIAEKVENSLKLDFGPSENELIFISDGSDDNTNEIIKSYQKDDKRLQFIDQKPRMGKANALNVAVSHSSGDVLIFSDSNVIINEKSVIEILKAFKDKNIGAVCGKVFVKPRGSEEIAGESLYMKYEGAIQSAESTLHSVIGIDGAFFAMRKEYYLEIPVDTILDDFYLSMCVLRKSKRILYEKNAIAIEEVIPSSSNEFKRKTRIVSGGYQYLFNYFKQDRKHLSSIDWVMLASHKILRWMSPLFMLLLFFMNSLLISELQYLFFAQLLFYAIALTGYLNENLRKNKLVYLPYFFCVINCAALVGLVRAFAVKADPRWKKVDR